MSQNINRKYQMEYHTRKGIEILQKTNRFFASNLGGVLYKRDRITDKLLAILAGQNTRILNNYTDVNPELYDIDYPFYENLIYQVVDAIHPRYVQLGFM
jgi:hypothetical protein